MIHIFECWVYFSFLFNITLHLYTVIYDPRAYKFPTLLYFRFYSGFLSTPHHVKFLGMRSLCIRPYDNDLSMHHRVSYLRRSASPRLIVTWDKCGLVG
jgi:hypothetical protein